MPDISITASIYPTEDGTRVSKAVLDLFPEADISLADDKLEAIAPNMDHFIMRMGEQKILDSARQILRKSIQKAGLRFYLNKQAAFSGRVNFTDGDSVLGDLAIIILTADPEKLVKQMTGGNGE